MPKPAKELFLQELIRRYPSIKPSTRSHSLFEIPELGVRIYTRYSKVHPNGRTFFGLRRVDLDWLQGFRSLICFIWDQQTSPLLIPYSDFEGVFAEIAPAQDGQYKAQVDVCSDGCELYIANAGRFNVEGYFGWNEKNLPVEKVVAERAASLSHSQVQTLLGSIGHAKGNDVWCPLSDRPGLDWTIASRFPVQSSLPDRFSQVAPILSEIDVIWTRRGSAELVGLFEVEHTTTIYSGLLRFNDVLLHSTSLCPRYSIVSNESRRSLFIRQVNRPTFRRSGLNDLCTFMEYSNVLDWHKRIWSSKS